MLPWIATRMRNGMQAMLARAAPYVTWPIYTRLLGYGSFLLVVSMLLLVVLVDPWKALPASLPIERPMSGANQRHLYPMLIRSGAFDSFVFGNSTAMLIDPAALGKGIGGRFANLALEDGRAWEQIEQMNLILAEGLRPRILLVTIDWVWCVPEITPSKREIRRFPAWLYRRTSWNNVWRLLNDHAMNYALRTLAHKLGMYRPRIRNDGYFLFLPPDERYDPARALQQLFPAGKPALEPPRSPPVEVSETERASWTFAALDRLRETLARMPDKTLVLFVAMPVHAVAQPVPGTSHAQREEACKQSVARVAAERGSFLIDFRIRSPVTLEDANYWDPLHYRVPVAERLVQAIVAARTSAKSDPDGFWRIVDLR